jgi:hypothetical protein
VEEKAIKVTHGVRVEIDDDGRSVEVLRASNGDFRLEWTTREPDNGNAYVSTKVRLSAEAMAATMRCVVDIVESVQADQVKTA